MILENFRLDNFSKKTNKKTIELVKRMNCEVVILNGEISSDREGNSRINAWGKCNSGKLPKGSLGVTQCELGTSSPSGWVEHQWKVEVD